MEQYVSKCLFLNTKPTVSNSIQSQISFTFKSRKLGKKNDDVMHKHDSVKDAQNCLTVHKKILVSK